MQSDAMANSRLQVIALIDETDELVLEEFQDRQDVDTLTEHTT